jgi:hypothetical protein
MSELNLKQIEDKLNIEFKEENSRKLLYFGMMKKRNL